MAFFFFPFHCALFCIAAVCLLLCPKHLHLYFYQVLDTVVKLSSDTEDQFGQKWKKKDVLCCNREYVSTFLTLICVYWWRADLFMNRSFWKLPNLNQWKCMAFEFWQLCWQTWALSLDRLFPYSRAIHFWDYSTCL